jgi:hypothetical protein
MTYPLSPSDFPALADLSLNDSHRPASRRPTSHVESSSAFSFPLYQMQAQDQQHLSRSGQYQSQWSVPGWQSTLYLASDSVPPIYSHGPLESPSSMHLPYTKSTMESLFLPRLSLPDLDCELRIVLMMIFQPDVVSAVSASPSNTSSSVYSDIPSSSSPPPSLHVVCDIPVVAPRPLPYHSPTFLQFDLPDVDEDLSHPPYTRCPKRKRKAADDLDNHSRAKRQAPSSGRRSASHVTVQCVETRAARRQRNR